jgi:thioredoxin 1
MQDVASECGVRAMPTFQAFFNGSKVDELTGADPGRLQTMIAK